MDVLYGDSTQGRPNVKRARILGDEPTDTPCCRATRGATTPGEGGSGAGRIGQVVENHPVADPQGIGDLQHGQTRGTEDLGQRRARSGRTLPPALRMGKHCLHEVICSR
jgi:hypothetical protein